MDKVVIELKQTVEEYLSPKQLEAAEKLLPQRGGDAFWKVGTGKTRLGLYAGAMAAYDECGMPPCVIVIARRAAFYDWRQEIATLQFGWEVKEIEDVLPVEATLGFDRETFLLVSDGLLINTSIVATLQLLVRNGHAHAIVIDEGWLFMNITSKRSKALKLIQRQADIPSFVLSGSIMPSRELTQIYGQVVAANKHRALANTQSDFRSRYQIGFQGSFFSRYPRKGAYAEIMQKIAPFSHLNFPLKKDREIKETILKVRPTPEQIALFKELKETWAVADKFELTHAANVIQKAQQISNGWLQADDGSISYHPSSKVERCLALVEEILQSDDKVVIWCAFRQDVIMLSDMLKHTVATMQYMSQVKFDIEAWLKPGKRVCVATEASGTSVNHFGQVPYGIYFSQDWKWRSLEQSQGRHNRKNSLHDTCYFTFLHTEKSMDSNVFYTVRASRSAEKSFIAQMDVQQWLNKK